MRTCVRMRLDAEKERAARLCQSGLSDREVARRTGLPRTTIGNWRRNPDRSHRSRAAEADWRPVAAAAYCYALGLYLGDGYIARSGNSARLSLTLDASHRQIAEEAGKALSQLFPEARVHMYRRLVRGTAEVQLSDPSLPYAFPHCGPGHKHEREIALQPWQADLTSEHPESLLRGLIHSDGCRTVNRFSTVLPSGRLKQYVYPRYFFSNLSSDIRQIFCDHCDLLGIRWTLSNPRNVSIANREGVALLDTFVGPKA
jgi:hypothetical protein